jgi:hypothetical protein
MTINISAHLPHSSGEAANTMEIQNHVIDKKYVINNLIAITNKKLAMFK